MKKAAPTLPARAHQLHQLTKRATDDSFLVLERNQGGRAVSGTHSKRKKRARALARASRRANRP